MVTLTAIRGHVDTFTRNRLPPAAEWPDLLLDGLKAGAVVVNTMPGKLEDQAAALSSWVVLWGAPRFRTAELGNFPGEGRRPMKTVAHDLL
jgi:hypothetical protein